MRLVEGMDMGLGGRDVEAGSPSGEEDRTPGYAIGAAAALTGLDPHTIRAWERRYGAVSPRRSPRGTRRYTERDLGRLRLLKALTDRGQTIGSVAGLPDELLRQQLAALSPRPGTSGGSLHADPPISVALCSTLVEAQWNVDPAGLGRLRLVARTSAARGSAGSSEWLEALRTRNVEVVVADLRALGPEPLRCLQRIQGACMPRLVILLYDFAPSAELARLGRAGARLVRAPIRLAQLRQLVEDLLAIDAASTAPAAAKAAAREPGAAGNTRRLDETQLARLLELRGGVYCECPSHLAGLVSSLAAFERYSRECESRSPGDAVLHQRLADATGRMRSELEGLLIDVCRHEGIPL